MGFYILMMLIDSSDMHVKMNEPLDAGIWDHLTWPLFLELDCFARMGCPKTAQHSSKAQDFVEHMTTAKR